MHDPVLHRPNQGQSYPLHSIITIQWDSCFELPITLCTVHTCTCTFNTRNPILAHALHDVHVAKRSTFTYSISYILWKLLVQRLILAINQVFWSILRGIRILLTHCNLIVHKIWHHVLHTATWPHCIDFIDFLNSGICKSLSTETVSRYKSTWGSLCCLSTLWIGKVAPWTGSPLN